MKNKVFSRNQLPTRFPITTTLLLYLMMDKFQAVGWVWGVVGTVIAILWIGSVITFITEESVDILNKKNDA